MSLPGLQATESADAVRARFDAARPFRHVVFEDFLEPELCRALIEEFPAFRAERALNEYGELGGKAVETELPKLGEAYARLDRLIRSPEFLTWLSQATGIPGLLYDPDYVGGGTHENRDGQELDPHVDFNYHPRTAWHRRLNLILFLNPEWREEWGGVLELCRNPWAEPGEEELVRVLPTANRAVVFETTESSWHGFPRIQLPEEEKHRSRRSVAVYFYSRERPPEQTVPEHGTYYVPRGLPERFRAGYTLTAGDADELRALFERRDKQLRALWDRERDLRDALTRTWRSPSLKLARALTWPLRAARRLAQR